MIFACVFILENEKKCREQTPGQSPHRCGGGGIAPAFDVVYIFSLSSIIVVTEKK